MSAIANEAGGLGRKHVLLKARPSLQIERTIQGGRAVYIVKDPLGLRYFHLESPQHFTLTHMDGRRTLEAIRRAYEQEFRPQRLTLDEVEDFARHLLSAGLIEVIDGPADRALERQKEHSGRRFWSRWLNLFHIKLPFGSPDAFLSRLSSAGRLLFHPAALFLGMFLVLGAAATVLVHWRQFTSELPTYGELFTWHTVLGLGAVFLAIKVLHELGHGLCCKTYQGRVQEMGIVFLFFFPTLYCNVSDSWLLKERWKRILINLAGIWVEFLIATLAVVLWRLTVPGHFLHSLALNTILISGVHTLLFNANPLMRFDGYFVLADWMEIPNLAARSQRAVQTSLARWFGADVLDDPIPGPRRFLLLYGIASLIYRCIVTAVMLWFFVLFMKEQQLRWLGLTLTAGGVLLVVGPATYHLTRTLAQMGRSAQMKPSRSLITVGLLTSLLAVTFLVPFPMRVRGMGVTQIDPDHRVDVVIPACGGFLDEVFIRDGEHVRKGDVLAILSNPDLERRLRLNDADQALRRQQQEALTAQMALFVDFKASKDGHAEIEHELRALAEQHAFLKRDRDALILRAPRDGIVMRLPHWEARGKWQAGGEVLFAIGDPSQMRVAALLDPADRQLLEDGRPVLFLPHGTGTARPGRISGISPAESTTIPSHLAGRVGGEIATRQDPLTRAEKPIAQHYLVTVMLPGTSPGSHAGVLGEVRMEAGSATLWARFRRWAGKTLATGW